MKLQLPKLGPQSRQLWRNCWTRTSWSRRCLLDGLGLPFTSHQLPEGMGLCLMYWQTSSGTNSSWSLVLEFESLWLCLNQRNFFEKIWGNKTALHCPTVYLQGTLTCQVAHQPLDLDENEYVICHGKSSFLKPEKLSKMTREHVGTGLHGNMSIGFS